MKKAAIWLLCGIIALLCSCDAGFLYIGNSTVTVEIQPLLPLEALSSSRAVLGFAGQTVSLAVQTNDGTNTSQTLSFDEASGAYTGSLTVKTGSSCTFTVEAKDASGSVYVKGSSQKDITSSAETLSITLAPAVSDTTPLINAPMFLFPFEEMTAGQVKVLSFDPEWESVLTCKASLLEDAVFAVCDIDGNTLASGTSQWTMNPADKLYILAAKTGDNPVLAVGSDIALVEFVLNLEDPEKPVINNGIALAPVKISDTLSVTVTSEEKISEFKWILKNRVLPESTGPEISIKLSDYSDLIIIGENYLTLAFLVNGRWYSAVIPFTVAE